MKEMTSDNSKILETRVGANVVKSVPQVSVVIPAYNVAEYIGETLDSALAQTFRDFEIIVVNDGSPDSVQLEKVLSPYFDEIIYIKQKNGGAAEARNTAISAARGSIAAFLDGDDVWMPEYLSAQISFLETNGYEMVYCDAAFIGEKYYKYETFMQQSGSRGAVTPASLLKTDCNVITSGTILLKSVLLKYGFFALDAPRIEDFDLWFRLAKNNVKIAYQRKVLLKYRVRLGSLTGNNTEMVERTIKALELVKKKNDLTGTELEIWHDRMSVNQAQLDLEKGKSYLAAGNFAEARASFRAANKKDRKLKLTAVMWLLTVNPKLTLKLFKRMRSNEVFFIAPNDL